MKPSFYENYTRFGGDLIAVSFGLSDAGPVDLEKAKKITSILSTGQMEAIRPYFNASLRAELSGEKMRRSWQQLISQTGEFEKIVRLIPTSFQGFDTVEVACAAQQSGILVRIIFDREGKVGGFWFFPIPNPETGGQNQSGSENGRRPTSAEIKIAEKIVAHFAKGEFAQVHRQLGADLQRGLSVEKMEEGWNTVISQTGEFAKIVKMVPTTIQGASAVEALCGTKQAGLLVRVVFSQQGTIGGLWVFPLPTTPKAGSDNEQPPKLKPSFP